MTIRPPKLIVCLAAAVCAFAAFNARAFNSFTPFTNFVTLTITAEGQTNSPSTNTANSTITYAKPTKGTLNTALILGELNGVVGFPLNGTNFSKAAKLVYIEGGNGNNPTGFAVLDGRNLTSVSNVMSLTTDISTNRIKSGMQNSTNGLASKTLSEISIVELDYDDTVVGGSITFNFRGIATTTTTDTVPSNGVYNETFSAKLTGMGSGVSIGSFIITGTASFSGSGQLTIPPT